MVDDIEDKEFSGRGINVLMGWLGVTFFSEILAREFNELFLISVNGSRQLPDI